MANRINITGIAQAYVGDRPLHWEQVRSCESLFFSKRLAKKFNTEICQECQSISAFDECWANCQVE